MLLGIFCEVLKMNCIAVLISMPVLAIKYILQKLGIPRKTTIILWLVIAFRLMCPVAVSSGFSIFNFFGASENIPFQAEYSAFEEDNNIAHSPVEADSLIDASDEPEAVKTVISFIWLAGVASVLVFGACSYLALKKRLRFAVRLTGSVYTADCIPVSFVFGIFAPKIYIPEAIPENNLPYIIAHEETHIERAHHIAKLIAYILLAVYWFNPLSWVMFRLFAADVEYACDESTVMKIGIDKRKAYMDTLIASAAVNKENKVLLYNVCFSASPAKRRILNLMGLRKPSGIINMAAAVICVLSFAAFGTDAAEHEYISELIVSDNSISAEVYVNQAIEETESYIEEKNEAYESAREMDDEAENEKKDRKINTSAHPLPEREIQAVSRATPPNSPDGNEYSYSNGCGSVISNVTCDEKGELSVRFNDTNAEFLADITVIDSETQEEVDSVNILAGSESSYTFSGLDNTKAYDVAVNGKTGSQWKVEGTFIIY